ncbi:MAG: metallophosphoesterase family protein [Desulfobacterales bacterium]|nr:metallophosphoesterase family protein [Desulfobacterales bacterium]
MKLAIISDIHGDITTLEYALELIKQFNCNMILCAGDLVGYGQYPEKTVALLKELQIPCVRGNHDKYARTMPLSPEAIEYLEKLPKTLHMTIEGINLAVCHGTLYDELEMIHPNDKVYRLESFLNEINAEILICGHSHFPFIISVSDVGEIINPGTLLINSSKKFSIGWIYNQEKGTFIPQTDSNKGTFGILELPSKRFTVYRAIDGKKIKVPQYRLNPLR